MKLDLSLGTKDADLWPELEKLVIEAGFGDEPNIKKAYDLAVIAHSDQKRESGEAFVTHPIWVAKIVTQLGIGRKAIMAALLHDTVEDTKVTLDEIASQFDDEVALLVAGLTEVKKKTHGMDVDNKNIEIFRKFLFSSVDDVRILIIRIVDKTHNGLTIQWLDEERRLKYAKRIFNIYGPIAEYVGLHYFKRVLEDIAFKILYPVEAKELEEIFAKRSKDEKKALSLVTKTINKIFKVNRIYHYQIEGRIKSLYSTYLKIKKSSVDRIKDRVGIRIIVGDIAGCYTALGLLHSKYNYIADEFDDYISSPKANGYRSIQTTLNWQDKLTVEVQIRTREMHEFNEFGPASHIAYKLSKDNSSGVGFSWVKDLIQWQKGDNNVNNYRINVLSRFVYVFTPKGDTIQMPIDSAALDFAYRIHTDIGDHCCGVKINNKMTKIDTVLKTGDSIEILTNKKLNVNKNWLDLVKDATAKDHIRKVCNGK